MRRRIFKRDEHNEQYLRTGYVLIDLFDRHRAESLLNELMAFRPDDNFSPENRRSTYHCTFLDSNSAYKRNVLDVCRRNFQPLIDELFHDYTIWNSSLYAKPPGKGEVNIHQNWTHVRDEQDTTFTLWCPLVDCTRENGTIELVEGSHKIVPDIATLGVAQYFENLQAELLAKYLQPIERDTGQCVIFEDGLVHYTRENSSESPRYALQVIIGPKEVTPVYFYHDPQNAEAGFEVFEVDEDFWLGNNYEVMFNRPDRFRSTGFVPNLNRVLKEQEFMAALENGPQRRHEIYG